MARKGPSDDTSSRDLVGAFGSEFLGTFTLVLFPTGIAALAASGSKIAGPSFDSANVAEAFGATLFILIVFLAGKSGANFNPAITLGLLVNRTMPLKIAVIYWIAQFGGAIAGSSLTRVLLPGLGSTGYGVTQPGQGIDFGTVFFIELIGTSFLTFAVASTALTRKSSLETALGIGVTLAVIVAFGGPSTGGAFNPARALGPMITSGRYEDVIAYVLGELIGGCLGVLLYVRGFRKVSSPV